MEACTCSPALVLQMESRARDVCVVVGTNSLRGPDEAGRLLTALRDYSAPNVMGAVYEGVANFSGPRKTTETMANLIGSAEKRKDACDLEAPSRRPLLTKC